MQTKHGQHRVNACANNNCITSWVAMLAQIAILLWKSRNYSISAHYITIIFYYLFPRKRSYKFCTIVDQSENFNTRAKPLEVKSSLPLHHQELVYTCVIKTTNNCFVSSDSFFNPKTKLQNKSLCTCVICNAFPTFLLISSFITIFLMFRTSPESEYRAWVDVPMFSTVLCLSHWSISYRYRYLTIALWRVLHIVIITG